MPMIPAPEGPSVNPTGAAMPFESIAGIEPNAFGASVGAARQAEGAAIGKAGDVMEKHAITLQNQIDEATNNEAVTRAIQAEGTITNEYQKLTGKAAQDALPQYYKDLEAARTKIRGELPSAFVQRMFDQATMRQFGYATVNGARYAATQAKVYANTTAHARLANQISSAAHTQDDNQFDKSVDANEIRQTLLSAPDSKDLPPEELERQVREKQAEAYAARVQTISYSEPKRAYELLNKYADKIDPQKAAPLRAQVVNQILSAGSRDISVQVVHEGATPFHSLLRAGVETGGADPYNTTLDNGRWTGGPVQLTNMTVGEVRQMQDKMRTPENRALYGQGAGSSAVGAPQIVSQTLDRLISEGIVKPTDKFDEATQDKIISVLAKQRGGDVAGLREEWQGLKNVPEAQIRAAFDASFGPNAIATPGDRGALASRARDMATQQAKALGLSETDTARFADAAERSTDARYAQRLADRRDAVLGDKMTVMQLASDSENPPRTEDEFKARAGKEGIDAWNRLDGPTQDRFRRQFLRNANNQPMTPEREEAFYKLVGMAQDPEQKREFLDRSEELIHDADLPLRYRMRLTAMAQDLRKNMDKPAPTDQAMRILQNSRMFEGTSIKPKSEGGTGQTWNHFRGALDAALTEEQKLKAGPPSADRIRQIGAQVMAQINQPKTFFGLGGGVDRNTPVAVQGARALDAGVPKDVADQLTAIVSKKLGRPLQPGELYRAYQNPEVQRRIRANPTDTPLVVKPAEASLADGPL